jgi:serine/threonine protein phosphatase 1
MVAVIGDIHGCYYTLVDLYNKIRQKYNTIPIYTVGDLIDRGSNSYQVMQFIIDESIEFTPGNHDYMFYHFFKQPDSIFAKSWIFNGNEATLRSYQNHEDEIFDHIELIKRAPLYFDLEDCFISHAGISSYYEDMLPDDFRKDLSSLTQHIYKDYINEVGVLWTRDKLIDLGKIQIVGHTKQKDIDYDEDSDALYIDTGACVGNKLSAVVIHKSEIVDTIEQSTNMNDLI